MEKTIDPQKAMKAQNEFCKKKNYPHFAPGDGRCFKCNNQIYSGERAISVERANSELITGCPYCFYSYCE